MKVFAIDPGTEESGWVLYETTGKVLDKGISPNVVVRDMIRNHHPATHAHHMAIEELVGYGMRVGNETFKTIKWSGIFTEAWDSNRLTETAAISRPDVKIHVCDNRQANDAAVNAALDDRYGGKKHASGNKKEPGPLYGVTKHMRAALAVAITFAETVYMKPRKVK